MARVALLAVLGGQESRAGTNRRLISEKYIKKIHLSGLRMYTMILILFFKIHSVPLHALVAQDLLFIHSCIYLCACLCACVVVVVVAAAAVDGDEILCPQMFLLGPSVIVNFPVSQAGGCRCSKSTQRRKLGSVCSLLRRSCCRLAIHICEIHILHPVFKNHGN